MEPATAASSAVEDDPNDRYLPIGSAQGEASWADDDDDNVSLGLDDIGHRRWSSVTVTDAVSPSTEFGSTSGEQKDTTPAIPFRAHWSSNINNNHNSTNCANQANPGAAQQQPLQQPPYPVPPSREIVVNANRSSDPSSNYESLNISRMSIMSDISYDEEHPSSTDLEAGAAVQEPHLAPRSGHKRRSNGLKNAWKISKGNLGASSSNSSNSLHNNNNNNNHQNSRSTSEENAFHFSLHASVQTIDSDITMNTMLIKQEFVRSPFDRSIKDVFSGKDDIDDDDSSDKNQLDNFPRIPDRKSSGSKLFSKSLDSIPEMRNELEKLRKLENNMNKQQPMDDDVRSTLDTCPSKPARSKSGSSCTLMLQKHSNHS